MNSICYRCWVKERASYSGAYYLPRKRQAERLKTDIKSERSRCCVKISILISKGRRSFCQKEIRGGRFIDQVTFELNLENCCHLLGREDSRFSSVTEGGVGGKKAINHDCTC